MTTALAGISKTVNNRHAEYSLYIGYAPLVRPNKGVAEKSVLYVDLTEEKREEGKRIVRLRYKKKIEVQKLKIEYNLTDEILTVTLFEIRDDNSEIKTGRKWNIVFKRDQNGTFTVVHADGPFIDE